MADETKKETRRVNLFLDPKTVERAKIYGIKEDISLSKMVDEALKLYLKQERV